MTKLGLKFAAVIAITIGLFIPLQLILGLIHDRTRYRNDATKSVALSWTGAQSVVGPVLAVPVLPDEKGNADTLFILPDRLDIQASLRTQTRKRGLYAVPVYTARLSLSGEFDLAAVASTRPLPAQGLDLDKAMLALSLSDNRGIVEQPAVAWAGAAAAVQSGSLAPLAEGLRAWVGQVKSTGRYPFTIEMELRGMETLEFAPVGADTSVTIDAGWSHPSFVGRFLPVEHEIGSDRFTARWKVSGLASGRRATALGTHEAGEVLLGDTFGVSLVNPVDIYQQATRSVKYGNLIVLLTFTMFFLVEILRRLLLHPVQYLLVGLALVIFFLLVVALSEHMAFGVAYLIAAVACVALIVAHTWSALRSPANGAAITGALGGLYAMLYAILRSEDNALLMGSLLLFCALAAVMLVTRRLDWHRLEQQLGAALTSGPSAGRQSTER